MYEFSDECALDLCAAMVHQAVNDCKMFGAARKNAFAFLLSSFCEEYFFIASIDQEKILKKLVERYGAVGDCLRFFRWKKRLSIEEFATILEVSADKLSRFEKDHTIPSLKVLNTVKNALELDESFFELLTKKREDKLAAQKKKRRKNDPEPS